MTRADWRGLLAAVGAVTVFVFVVGGVSLWLGR